MRLTLNLADGWVLSFEAADYQVSRPQHGELKLTYTLLPGMPEPPEFDLADVTSIHVDP